ncbi:hypothetical protein L6452_05715 [Arctium lappa]|uniref:Uncharacterized protein n=1 Tax=Arctium lappa TaxID=4217 RepID=A0ACB9EHU6_ARCLA|nr:hypothetical protein L6452_05715 [Arctium lappa]
MISNLRVPAGRSPICACRSPFDSRRTPLAARRSLLVARRSPLVASRSPLVARRSPLSACGSSVAARRWRVKCDCVNTVLLKVAGVRGGRRLADTGAVGLSLSRSRRRIEMGIWVSAHG